MPTALELSRDEWKRYIGTSSRRRPRPILTEAERRERERLRRRVRDAVAVLKARFAVRRVVLFGSLAHEAWFVSDSDVDLAVEGLDAKDYWRAWRLVEEIIADRPVDLVEIEAADDALARAIRRYGVER
ncbi:MAG: nucleotidyltransferase family protein [Anaerolineae bacterium]